MATSDSDSPAKKGIALLRAGNADEALPFLRQASADDPENPEMQKWLGICLSKRGKWVDAQHAFERAMELDGASADYPFYAGVCIAKQGRLREANGMFVVALGNDPNHAKAKLLYEQTKGAAAVVTTEGSSSAMPGGLSSVDIFNMDDGSGKSVRPSDPMAAALADFKRDNDGGKKVAKGKKGGCGSGIVAVMGLLAVLIYFVASLA